MKMQKALYEEIKAGMKIVAEKIGIDRLTEGYRKASLSHIRMAWDLYNVVNDNKRCDDNHPAFKNSTRERYIPFVSHDWSPYNHGLNDDHIQTALLKIVKELGLI